MKNGHISCTEARELIEKSFYDSLTQDERQVLDSHLSGCVDCKIWEGLEQMTRRAVKLCFPPVEMPRDFRESSFFLKL